MTKNFDCFQLTYGAREKLPYGTDLHDINHEDVECDGLLWVEDGGHLDLQPTLRDGDLLLGYHLTHNVRYVCR